MKINNWNSELYDGKHAFVSKYGEDVVRLLEPRHGERILDLGCGTGDLTLMLAQAGYDVIGIDRSEEMLSVLREKADELGLTGRLLLLRQAKPLMITL